MSLGAGGLFLLCRSVPFNFLNSFEGCQVEQTASEDSQLSPAPATQGPGAKALGLGPGTSRT